MDAARTPQRFIFTLQGTLRVPKYAFGSFRANLNPWMRRSLHLVNPAYDKNYL